jgi:hypothetical protein
MNQRTFFELRNVGAVKAAALLVLGPASVHAFSATRSANAMAGSVSATVVARPGAVPAAYSACKPVFDANNKTLDTSNHAYMDGLGADNKKRTDEVITVNGDRYVMVNGKWTKSRMTVAATKAQEDENIKNAKVLSCKRAGDESVSGEAATSYTEHSETEDTKSDGKIWISKSRGVILKEEIELDSGDAGKQHITMRYEYGNVKAPL